jgi:hypothetical protein
MILVAAVLVAVLIGLVRGGSLRRLAELPLRWGSVTLVAFGMQIYTIYFPETTSQGFFSLRGALLFLSYVLMFVVVWQNRRLPGVWVIGAGLLANFAVMALNGGYMPISPEALEQVGHNHRVVSLEPGARVRASKDILLPRDQTTLWWMADVFVLAPPFPIPSVFSLGDVLIALGMFRLIQNGMRDGQKKPDSLGEDYRGVYRCVTKHFKRSSGPP